MKTSAAPTSFSASGSGRATRFSCSAFPAARSRRAACAATCTRSACCAARTAMPTTSSAPGHSIARRRRIGSAPSGNTSARSIPTAAPRGSMMRGDAHPRLVGVRHGRRARHSRQPVLAREPREVRLPRRRREFDRRHPPARDGDRRAASGIRRERVDQAEIQALQRRALADRAGVVSRRAWRRRRRLRQMEYAEHVRAIASAAGLDAAAPQLSSRQDPTVGGRDAAARAGN